jgi:hypothetical protein
MPAKTSYFFDPKTRITTEYKYGTVASLLRVEKQTCADVSTLLYRCPARPFEIEVSSLGIYFGKNEWYDIPSLLVTSSRTPKHINSLSKCRLDRIRHLQIKISASRFPQPLFSLLANIRKLRHALQNDSAVNIEEYKLDDVAASSCLAKLEINLTFEKFDPTLQLDFYPSEIWACARLILQLFRSLPARFRWCIEWKVDRSTRYLAHGNNAAKNALMTLSNKRRSLKNMKIDKEDFDNEANAFRAWTKRWNSIFINTVLVCAWQQFKELGSLVADLINLKLLRDDHGCSSFMYDVRVARENRDSEALEAIKSQLREVSQEFVAAKVALLHNIQQKFLLDASADGEQNMGEVLYDPSSYMSWPFTTLTKSVLYLGEPSTVLLGTLEKHVDAGRTVYQLITPDLVSKTIFPFLNEAKTL